MRSGWPKPLLIYPRSYGDLDIEESKKKATPLNSNLLKKKAKNLARWSKWRAKKRGLEYDLSYEWIRQKIVEGCPVTGRSFELKKGKIRAFGPSLDRINSSKGYTKQNTRVVCLWYNLAKSNWDNSFIQKVIKETVQFWEGKCS